MSKNDTAEIYRRTMVPDEFTPIDIGRHPFRKRMEVNQSGTMVRRYNIGNA